MKTISRIISKVKHVYKIYLAVGKNCLDGVYGYPGASIEPIMPFLKSKFGKEKIEVLEIGARTGDSSEMIIRSLNVARYLIIDPYTNYKDYEYDGFSNVILEKGGDSFFSKIQLRLSKYDVKVEYIRDFSQSKDVLSSLKLQQFDLIFIDGNHEYKYVLSDLKNYFPLVKYGGILCGDDFQTRKQAMEGLQLRSDRPMVYEAVEDFSRIMKLKYLTFGYHGGFPKIYAFIKKALV